MSLKAKLEAVIYAAEEPVTLAQLAALFADEVLPGLDEAASQEAEQIGLAGLSPDEEAAPTLATPSAEEAPAAEAAEPVAAEPVAAEPVATEPVAAESD